MSFLRALQPLLPLQGALFCRSCSDHMTGVPGVMRYMLMGKPGERQGEEEYQFEVYLLLSSVSTWLPETSSYHLGGSVQCADPLRDPFFHMPLCFWETFIIPPVAGIFRGKHIIFC